MKKLIAVLTIVTLIAVPTFVQSVGAAPVSPSSSAFGGNGYWGLVQFDRQPIGSSDWGSLFSPIVTLIAVPTFVQSASAVPVSPSSSSFGSKGYVSHATKLGQLYTDLAKESFKS
jgi:hypothetical protein